MAAWAGAMTDGDADPETRLGVASARRRVTASVQVAPQDRPWMWASGHNGEIRRAAHG
jgi:hypothetical protein